MLIWERYCFLKSQVARLNLQLTQSQTQVENKQCLVREQQRGGIIKETTWRKNRPSEKPGHLADPDPDLKASFRTKKIRWRDEGGIPIRSMAKAEMDSLKQQVITLQQKADQLKGQLDSKTTQTIKWHWW